MSETTPNASRLSALGSMTRYELLRLKGDVPDFLGLGRRVDRFTLGDELVQTKREDRVTVLVARAIACQETLPQLSFADILLNAGELGECDGGALITG